MVVKYFALEKSKYKKFVQRSWQNLIAKHRLLTGFDLQKRFVNRQQTLLLFTRLSSFLAEGEYIKGLEINVKTIIVLRIEEPSKHIRTNLVFVYLFHFKRTIFRLNKYLCYAFNSNLSIIITLHRNNPKRQKYIMLLWSACW